MYCKIDFLRNKNIDLQKYLESYVQVYLEEEILQEGLTRNLANFSRFLEVASFSQGSQLNISAGRKKGAKRSLISQNKFYFSMEEIKS